MIDAEPVNANQDPMLRDMQEAQEFFGAQFGLAFDESGQFVERPSDAQLDALADWREQTFAGGIEMADEPTFARKVLLAQALMPQRGPEGQVNYLFGKGCGVEISVRGQVEGRQKLLDQVPYRTHADFEIYNFNQAEPPFGYDAFSRVFGGQEIYPPTQTKALKQLPEDYLSSTAEAVGLGGITVFVPKLEAQFVDKLEKRSEATERRLRGNTDAEWLAATYDLNEAEVHELLQNHVVEPAEQAFQPAQQLKRITKNALLMGGHNVANAAVALDGGNVFRLDDYGIGSEILTMDETDAVARLNDCATEMLTQKHVLADQELAAGESLRAQ